MARVLSRQRRSIRRKMTAQYRMSEKHASEKLARVLSRQRRSIRRKMAAQYKMSAKPPSKKLARVLSRQRRSIRREMTAQYKMSAKPPSKKLAKVLSRQRGSIRREMTAQYKMSQKVASTNWRESRPRKHRFRFLQRRYSTQEPGKTGGKLKKYPHRKEMKTGGRRLMQNLLGTNWREFRHRTTRRENIHANSHISENTRQAKKRGRRHGEATKITNTWQKTQ